MKRCSWHLLQLPQVTQGSHPEGAKVSALEHVPGKDAIIKPDHGLLLIETGHLHPAVCGYISEGSTRGSSNSTPRRGSSRSPGRPEQP
jgi:uncharacterized protein